MTKGRGRRRETDTSAHAPVRTLERGLAILDALADKPNLAVAEIAEIVELPLSTVYRLLETLLNRGLVEYNLSTRCYAIGIRAFHIGHAFVKGNELVAIADAEMMELVREVNETVNLAIRDEVDAVYVHQVEGSRLVRMFTQLGARTPLHASGVGKALLAWESPRQVHDVLAKVEFRTYTPNTLTTISDLLAELDVTRKRGYGLDLEERELGVVCVAAPIFNHSGKVVAALSVSAPSARMESLGIRSLADRIIESANSVARRLGWAGEATGAVPEA